MKQRAVILTLAIATALSCSRDPGLQVSTGSDVTVQKKDGVVVAGRLVEVKSDQIVVETRNGARTPVARAEIASVRADVKPEDARPDEARPAPVSTAGSTGNAAATDSKPSPNLLTKIIDRGPEYREVTIPAGTILPLDLQTAVGSDTSRVEDPVRATLRRAVRVGGLDVLPAGTAVFGHVTDASRSARVKGRARVAFRFTRLDPPGETDRVAIQTGVVSLVAPATKKQDAAKIGGGAAGGAIVGGILGGGDGAAKGAAVGGAAGTGVVLSTRGKEVRLGPGADLSVRLQAPVTVRVLVKK